MINLDTLNPVSADRFDLDMLDEFSVKKPSYLFLRDERTKLDKLTGPIVDWFLRKVQIRVESQNSILIRYREWNQDVVQVLPFVTTLHIGMEIAGGKVELDPEGNAYIRVNPAWHKNPLYIRIERRFKDAFNFCVLKMTTSSMEFLAKAKESGNPAARAIALSLKIYDDKEEALRQKAYLEEFKSKVSKATKYLESMLGSTDDDTPPEDDERTLH